MKKYCLLLLPVAFIILAAFTPAEAAEFRVPKSKTSTLTITDTLRNLFAGAMNVQIKAPVKGDLFVGGNSVNVAGDVEADAFLAGQNVTVSSPVSGDLFVAGQNVHTDSAATVDGDLQAAGAFVTINGPVKGSARIGGAILIAFVAACFLTIILVPWQAGVYLTWLFKSRQAAELKPDFSWITFATGVLAVAILGFIPFLGPLAKFILFLMALGAIASRLTTLSRAEQAR